VFWVIPVYFNIRNTFPKSGTFLLGHSVYIYIYIYITAMRGSVLKSNAVSQTEGARDRKDIPPTY
jgi:hypothetical protein